ncbi:hypothetical protein AAG593_09900 [Citromicrobium bathyomarinum]
MPSKIHVDPTLHQCGFEERIRETYKGMAHLAGTHPGGGRCRACTHWSEKQNVEERARTKSARCHYPLPGKSKVQVPGQALACRFFEQFGKEKCDG